MTFANVSANRERLQSLSQLLITVFPGCVIHQSCDPVRTITHLSAQKVDAVFADEDTYPDLMRMLSGHRSKPSVYLLCRQEHISHEKAGDGGRVITYPVTGKKIQFALQTSPQEIGEVI